MLSVKIICVGKLKERFYSDAVDEYVKRLGAYCRPEIAEISEALKKTMEALSDSQNALNSLTAAIQQEYSARQQKAQ